MRLRFPRPPPFLPAKPHHHHPFSSTAHHHLLDGVPPTPHFILHTIQRALRCPLGSHLTPAIHAVALTSGLLVSNYLLSASADHSLVSLMHRLGAAFDHVTFSSALASAFHSRDALPFVVQLHSHLLKSGFQSYTVVGNSLITGYSRSGGRPDDARKVFDEMPNRDVVSWNALISGMVQGGGSGEEAIWIFVEMNRKFTRPDSVSIASTITACGHEKELVCGEQIHAVAVKVGLEPHTLVSNALMSMYVKCGAVEGGRRVFVGMESRDVVSWTTAIAAAADSEGALELFQQMRMAGVQPNEVTFVRLIHAAASASEVGMLHGLYYRMGFSSQLLNVYNGLVSAYARAGSVDEARKVFDDMDRKELLSWNALISGYAQNCMCKDALVAFSSLLLQQPAPELKPDQFTLGSLISAISRAETVPLAYGLWCHCHVVKLGLESNKHVSGALIDMYAKRGSIADSQKLFDQANSKTLVTWTSMISAHALHGKYELVTELFDEMVDSGICPDHVAFLTVLMACGHQGMVRQGLAIFTSMRGQYGVEPWREHYTSVVDMLARAGRLDEAKRFIEKMPMEPSVSMLQSLLGVCRIRGDAEMGQKIADSLLEVEPAEAGTYVQLANIYAERGKWEEVARVRKGMEERGVRKEVGFSWVDVGGGDDVLHMHRFSSDDTNHPRYEEIYEMAWCLRLGMRSLDDDLADYNDIS